MINLHTAIHALGLYGVNFSNLVSAAEEHYQDATLNPQFYVDENCDLRSVDEQIAQLEAGYELCQDITDHLNNSSKWSKLDKRVAQSQGWDLFAVDGDQEHLAIQRIDEMGKFSSDAEAIRHVVLLQHPVAEKALTLVAKSHAERFPVSER